MFVIFAETVSGVGGNLEGNGSAVISSLLHALCM